MIQIQNITKQFEQKMIFNNFSMKIESGRFVVFAGKSGCGKTTLLNLIGGLEQPDKGKIIIDGLDLSIRKNMKFFFLTKVGFLFQNFALIEDETVRQNLEYVQKKARTEKTIDDILKEIGLQDKADTVVYKLSGGEQQRVALARLMLKKCDIILADEPTGSLDSENEDAVLHILHQMNQNGKTIVLVTHSQKIISNEKDVVML